MIEIIDKILPVIVGGLLVWAGTYIADRRKRRNDRLQSLKEAYQNFFAAEEKFIWRMRSLASASFNGSNERKHDIIMSEIKALEEGMEDLTNSLYKVRSDEDQEICRETISTIHHNLQLQLNVLKDSLAGNYNAHKQLREVRHLLDKLVNSKPEESDQQITHDSGELNKNLLNIPPQILSKIIDAAESTHNQVEEFMFVLAQRWKNR